MKEKRFYNNFILLFGFMTILAYQFYGAHFMNPFVIKFSCTILIAFLLLYTNKYLLINRNDIPFYNITRTIFFSMLCAMLMTFLFKGQSIPLSFTIMARSALQILFFFFLWKCKPSRSELETYIIIFGFLYIILWCYAMYKFPTITFGDLTSSGEFQERGILRINFVGRGNLIIAFFICLNKFKVNVKDNIKWIMLSIIFFIFIVLQTTRQLILWPFVIGLLYLVWENKKMFFIFCIIIVICFFVAPEIKFSDDSLVTALLNQTESQLDNQRLGQDDIRVLAYKFYFTEWHDNVLTFLFGTGMPHGASDFGRWNFLYVNERLRIFSSDVGYAQMFEMFGLFGLFLFVRLFIKGVSSIVSPSLAYTRLWFFFMIPGNIAAAWYIKPDFMIPTVICLYLMGQDIIARKSSKKGSATNSTCLQKI